MQSADIDVVADTSIDTNTFSWGNSFGLERHTLSVLPGAKLTVNSPNTGDPDNKFRGTLRLDGGTLVVNTTGDWTLPASSLLLPGGALELDGSHATPHLAGKALAIGGSVFVTGGVTEIDSDATFLGGSVTQIDAGATLDVNGSTGYHGMFTGDGTLQHNGSAFFVSSAPFAISHFVQNGKFTFASLGSSEAELDTTSVRFAPGSETRLFSDLRIRGAATIDPGATFTSTGKLIIDAAGSLGGSADVDVSIVNEGTVAPGSSPGTLHLGGDYTQTGTLEIELGGLLAGTQHDVLSVDGDIGLDGVLDVLLYGGFHPSAGDRFDVLDWGGSLTGAFASLVFPAGTGPADWDVSRLYVSGELRFVPEPSTLLLLGGGLAWLGRARSRRERKPATPWPSAPTP